MAFTMASAADITVDFSAAVDQLPAAETEELTTASIDGVNFTFYCCKGTGYQGANYLMVSGKKFEGAYVEFTVPQATKSFTLTTGSSASVSVMVQLSANDTNVGEAVKLDAKGADFKFDIPEANQAAGTVYRLTVTNKYNAQITKMVFTDTATTTPEEPETPAENYKKVSKVTADSSYVFVASGKYNALYSKNYGYMSATNVPKEATATGFNGEAAAAIKYVAVEGGYNLVTTEGKYLGAKADYNTFDTTDDSAANRVWTVSIDKDGKATVTNVATNKIVMQDPNYGSFGCYNAEDAANYVLPELYELTPVTSTPVEPVEPELVKAKSIKDVIALEAKTKFVAEFAMTVGWVFKSNVFVCDEAGDFIQIYGSNTLKVGDVIPAGLEGTYDLFNDTPEIVDATIPEVTAGTFEAKVVAAADINNGLVNSVVTINDVVFAEDTPGTKNNFTGISNGVELSFRNNYEIEGVAAGTYNVTVVVTVFKGAPSLYVINYEKATGVADIEAADNAPVEYFNLQGVRVANPENGLYIRRQGANVQKVMVR